MKSGKKSLAAVAATIVCAASAPAAAQAAITGAVTGDDGAPVALAPNGAAAGIRNMDVQALTHVDDAADARGFTTSVVDPAGVGASTPGSCSISKYDPDDKRYVDYHGNGTYKLIVTTYSDTACTANPKTYAYSWAVSAGVALGQPAGPLATRQSNSFSTITQSLDFAGTPGATTYEIKYALNGALNADGSLQGIPEDAYLDRTTGKVQMLERTPGTYLMVARARAGNFYTAWSPPITIHLLAPFDLSSRSFPDSRGPSYQVRGILGETSAAGKVTVAVAPGKKGKRFRTLGKAKVNGQGVFKLRFRLTKTGYYRLRYSFAGSSTVSRGTVYEVVRVRRTRVF
jgi:hypothetical protein